MRLLKLKKSCEKSVWCWLVLGYKEIERCGMMGQRFHGGIDFLEGGDEEVSPLKRAAREG